MPDIGEYNKEMRLAFEKEVLGIYVSGHPLEEYQGILQRYITNTTNDFALDDETGSVIAQDQSTAVVGGMIAEKTIKYTKNDKVMAFLNVEDLVGNVEVVVFPKDYEKYSTLLVDDAKIFIKGRVSVEEEKDGKLICEQIVSFDEAMQTQGGPLFKGRGGQFGQNRAYGQNGSQWGQGGGQFGQGNGQWGQNGGQTRYQSGNHSYQSGVQPGTRSSGGYAGAGSGADGQWNGSTNGQSQPAWNGQPTVAAKAKYPDGVWIQFATPEEYGKQEQKLLELLADSDGNDQVVIFVKNPKGIKVLPPNRNVHWDEALQAKLGEVFGTGNVVFRGQKS